MSGSSTKITISELDDAVAEYLHSWDENLTATIENEAKKSMKELVKTTKATAPVGRRAKHYRDSISSKCQKALRTVTYTWYVKGSDYRLSHLLEKGHALRNGGRTSGTHFIQKASDPILEKYQKAIEEAIRNG